MGNDRQLAIPVKWWWWQTMVKWQTREMAVKRELHTMEMTANGDENN